MTNQDRSKADGERTAESLSNSAPDSASPNSPLPDSPKFQRLAKEAMGGGRPRSLETQSGGAEDVATEVDPSDALSRPGSGSSSLFRFSLRTLIAVMIIAAGVAGWYGLRQQRRQRQLDIVAPLQKQGAVASVWEGDVVRITFNGANLEQFDPSQLETLAGLPYLKRLVLIDTDCDARVLPHLAKLTSLEELLIIDADLAGADLAPLTQLTNLRSLWICNAQLTDNSLDPIGEMTSLRILNLNDNRIGDNGLLRLAGLIELERLHLSNSSITDNGIDLVKQTMLHVKIQREPFAGYQP